MNNYRYNNSPDFKNVDLKLYYCGSENCSPSHSWGPGIKDHYKIHYIHSGKGIFQSGNITYNLTKGQLFLITPDIVSYYEADPVDPWSYSWVAFSGLNAEPYLNRTTLSSENPIMLCSRADSIIKCLNEMFEASESENSRDIRLLGSLYTFLGILVDESNSTVNSTWPLRSGSQVKSSGLYVKKAVEFIETNYSRRITVKEIAEYVGLNMKYLSKLFSEALGISPQYFLINYRLDKACELMRFSSLSIVEISNSIGYSDPLLFSRIFKKYKGLAPRSFREGCLK